MNFLYSDTSTRFHKFNEIDLELCNGEVGKQKTDFNNLLNVTDDDDQSIVNVDAEDDVTVLFNIHKTI